MTVQQSAILCVTCLMLLPPGARASAAKQRIAVAGDVPNACAAAAEGAGWDVVAASKRWPADADCALVVTRSLEKWRFADPRQPHPELARQQQTQQQALETDIGGVLDDAPARLAEGKTLLISLGEKPSLLENYEKLLPINLWSAQQDRAVVRRSGGATAPGASPLAGLNLAGFLTSYRFDLHLPYAAIEAGEHRYRFRDYADDELGPEQRAKRQSREGKSQWISFQKDFQNSDWQVLLASDQDGRLPLMITGRYGAGHIVIFAASLYDESLTAWAGYPAFIGGLLKSVAPISKPVAGTDATPLTMSIAQQQSLPLHVRVNNPAAQAIDVVLSYKVCNAERALLNSATVPISIAAGQSADVPLVERSAELGDERIRPSADRTPYRMVDAAILPRDLSRVAAEAHALIDIGGPVILAIRGPDLRTAEDLKDFPDRENGRGLDFSGGSPIDRYVYPTGTAMALTVTLSNAMHNIAPLARAKDLNQPDNLTAQGLNDMALSQGDLRGMLPLYATWAGRSAAEQKVELRWPAPVTVAGSRILGTGSYRNWSKSNPRDFELSGGVGVAAKSLAVVKEAKYAGAMHADEFSPAVLDTCDLHVIGLNPEDRLEPGSSSRQPSNCAIQEWEVLGWPGAQLPPKVSGRLLATATDLFTGQARPLLDEEISLDAFASSDRTLQFPGKESFGPVRVDVSFTEKNGVAQASSLNMLFVPPGRKAIVPLTPTTMGLLCSPGFIQFDELGLGTVADTQGWGGADDKIWAVTHDFMELGANRSADPRRMLTTEARFCHYTDPWRDFPSGEYFWDYAAGKLEEMVASGRLKGVKTVRIFLSDRWNGVPIYAQFAWDDLIRFDEALRAQTGKGLSGRTHKQLCDEIMSEHGDEFQRFEMDRYADKLLDVQKRLAAKGVEFTVTTHGSFPLVGGELGRKIAMTHKDSGTDLFWDLKAEDLYHTLGLRWGLVAANPDFESGAYNEWGWCSSFLNNVHWFSCTGTVEPSRRQWYSAYFLGRVTSAGAFEPLTTRGFYAQGAFGVKNTENDWEQYYRVQQLATKVRPEAPAGIGMVVSWPEQIRHMGKQGGEMGTGLYAAAGHDQIDAIAGAVFERLTRNGIPISFVASTDTLKGWKAPLPLLAVDAFAYTSDELAELDRLNRAGAAILAVGGGDEGAGSAETEALLGVRKSAGQFEPLLDTAVIDYQGKPLAFVTHHAGRGPTLFCPVAGKELGGPESAALAAAVRGVLGDPLTVSPGLATTSFINDGQLFLALTDQGDVCRDVSVNVDPQKLAPGVSFPHPRVIDLDRGVEVPFKSEGGRLSFTLPCAASDGRMIVITAG